MNVQLLKSNLIPKTIISRDISSAWAAVLTEILNNPGVEISPLIVSINFENDATAIEDNSTIKHKLDRLLISRGKLKVDDVAYTIFPQKLWQNSGGERRKLYKLYMDNYQRMKAWSGQKNGRGLYFQRMIDFPGAPCEGNQLEWIISGYNARPSVRRSMLQISIFDPARDHVSVAQLGFPCMQHLSFVPTNSGLVVNAFYATQQVFDKAYGNYLGLCQLGQFVANEIGVELRQVNINVGVAKLQRITKGDPELLDIANYSQKILNRGQITILGLDGAR